jgi:hypothetical protein
LMLSTRLTVVEKWLIPPPSAFHMPIKSGAEDPIGDAALRGSPYMRRGFVKVLYCESGQSLDFTIRVWQGGPNHPAAPG